MMRIAAITVLALTLGCAAAQAAPEGQMTWAVHVTAAPTWFDPAETSGVVANHPYSAPYEDLTLKAR